jgi:hypothetical protein
MPKKFLPHHKKKWLELSESGKSEKWIANQTKCDPRTVKKGIEEARRERNAAIAQIELVKEALRDHKDQLLAVIDDIKSVLVMPPDNIEIRRDKDGTLAPIPLSGATVKPDKPGGLMLLIQVEEKVEWELLQEHLKGDKIWKIFRQWKESILAYIKAIIDLELTAGRLIKARTGLQLVDEITRSAEIGYICPAVVQIFYEVAQRHSLGIKDGTNIEERVVASPDGYVRNGPGGTELAYAPNSQEDCKNELLDALRELYESPEAEQVSISYKEAQELTEKAKRILDEISLLRLVPGSCRVCQRLGV